MKILFASDMSFNYIPEFPGIDMVASAVIAMHTHCPQGYKIYNNSPIVYSMENFSFPHRDDINNPKLPPWYHGYMIELEYFNKYLTYISDIIKDDKKLSD